MVGTNEPGKEESRMYQVCHRDRGHGEDHLVISFGVNLDFKLYWILTTATHTVSQTKTEEFKTI